MDLTLVPFGYSQAESRLVDVHEVPSGKRCGCHCPSCKAPLIARKGQRKAWHFAHDSQAKAGKDTTLERCRYSFFVSARMMARQLVTDPMTVALPGHRISVTEQDAISGELVEATETVTTARGVTLTDVSIDARVDGGRADFLGHVKGHCLAFVFLHPGRDVSDFLPSAQGGETGVVAVNLESLKARFRTGLAAAGSYQTILTEFLCQDVDSKHWLFHPREGQASEQARKRLQIAVDRRRESIARDLKRREKERDFKADILKGLDKAMQQRADDHRYRFVCRLCNASWEGSGRNDDQCTQCRSALLVSRELLQG